MPPRRPKPKDTPAKLASRMKRRWRVVLLRAKGEILGTVEAPDVASAKAAAAVQFGLDEIQRDRIMVQELGSRGGRQRRATRCHDDPARQVSRRVAWRSSRHRAEHLIKCA